MKIVIINGSARKGNTWTAIQEFTGEASKNHAVEVISADKLHIAPCKGCESCKNNGDCIDKDDTNPTVDKIIAADMIIFATPVYWWGMSAQMKLIIDKCYSKGHLIKNKKIGVIVIGADVVTSTQYELIHKQFECMAGYLSWDILFQKSYSASGRSDLSHDAAAVAELSRLGSEL